MNTTDTSLLELAARVRAWARKTFPNQTVEGLLAHLAEEAREVKAAPDDLAEKADVWIVFLHLCALLEITPGEELFEAVAVKMDVNERRRWQPADTNGVHHHEGGRSEFQISNSEFQTGPMPKGFAQAAVVDKELAQLIAAARDMLEEGDFARVKRLGQAIAQRAALLRLDARADEAGVVKGVGR